jgi:type IV pilus assembly protein PilM
MAAAQKVVTVDLGTSTLKVGEFGVSRGGALTLLRFGVAELGLDPNKEEDRGPFVTAALAKLFKDQGVRGREVQLSISGQSVFMRFVKLPPVAADQVEQVVAFEAQQNVPFPINEVTWDYQMMPNRGTGAEAEAVIVAIKKDVLEAEVAAVEKAGVRIKHVDVAPFSLLNAFRYSEPQNDDCALILDMGARSTNLIFVEKSSFWIRNVPIAGNQISQSICNELQEPFMAAETLKKGKGFVSLGGVYADPDDADAARISKLIRTTMTRLHVDINRSVAFYRTSLGGTAPKRVFLTGGSSQLPYLDLFIADKLSLPVAFFNPLRNVNLGPNLNTAQLQQTNCYTGELVGLALRRTGSCPAEVTLDAPTLAARTDKKRKQPYFYMALFAWIVLFVCLGLWYWQQTQIVTETAVKLREQTAQLKVNAPKILKLSKQAEALQDTIDLAVRLGQQRNAWPALLDALNNKIPEGVWITQLTPAFDPKAAAAEPATHGTHGATAAAGGDAASRAAPRRREIAPTRQLPARASELLGGYLPPTDQINVLVVNGLYHVNPKTPPVVDPDSLRDFIQALAAMPLFDIEPTRATEKLTVVTAGADPLAFAEKFSMKLPLKQPIELSP